MPIDAAEVVSRPGYIPIYIPPEELEQVEREDPTLAELWRAQTPEQCKQAQEHRVFLAPSEEERRKVVELLEKGDVEGANAIFRSGTKKVRRVPARALAAANRAVELRQARDEGWPQGLAFLARALILTSLPQRRTKQTKVIREIRTGSETLTVVFTAAGRAELPYGADMNVLHYLFDHLDSKAEQPFIRWESAAAYFRWWGMDPESPKNQRDLRDRWNRLSSLVIQIAIENEHVSEQYTAALFPQARLPGSIDRRKKNQLCLPGQEFGVMVNPECWPRLAKNRVPVPKTVLRALRDDPFLMRLTLWLNHRIFATKSQTLVPWDAVQTALGSDDGKERRFRSKVRDGVREIRLWWPELNVEAETGGLRVNPGPLLIPEAGPKGLPKAPGRSQEPG
jgi:hypothetical protein